MNILTFSGPIALSDFRRKSLIARCQEIDPALLDLQVRFFYLVKSECNLTDQERKKLEYLINISESSPTATKHNDENVVQFAKDQKPVRIAPRLGTISPWSSKATDILHNCGLSAVDRIERGTEYRFVGTTAIEKIVPLLYDSMTEAILHDDETLFETVEPRPLLRVSIQHGREMLEQANIKMGLALSDEELDYLYKAYASLARDPTDVELVMFANVNSEHCRHKIFNASWSIDGDPRNESLFSMVRNTHVQHPEWTVKAYADNAGVIEGWSVPVFRPAAKGTYEYTYCDQLNHIVCKVETHNHPTAISPYPGASTGVGGEIRDEGATGIGGQPQAGLCAFYTSHLRIPDFEQPWEQNFPKYPSRIATPLEIMKDGPLGGAAFGNEFGRPNILGLFRTYEEFIGGRYRGYHKPIMVAGGTGLIASEHVEKKHPQPGDCVIQLGGPAMLIGLGGGYSSSMDTGSNEEELDFASVQRDNPEMERRCQELINRCISMGSDNPIVTIHDVGAGGLSNACPELVEGCGARFDLRAILNDDPGMSPMEIWCNEAQERYVLVVHRENLQFFEEMARRERCLYALIGEISGDENLSVCDSLLDDEPVNQLPLEIIIGKPPRIHRDVNRLDQRMLALDRSNLPGLSQIVARVLRYPAVADKTFLITIADRTVTGLVARDQMVGPYQTPISDVAVTVASFRSFQGSAMAMGERSPLALLDAPASGRIAIAEAITNIAAASIGTIEKVKLSANWMCACGEEGEDAILFDTVEAVSMEFCPELGVSIPVGKDSLSMRTLWKDDNGETKSVVAPLSLVISAFAPVEDIRATVTADLKPEVDSQLLLIDLGLGCNRLGGSCLAQVFSQVGDTCPDVAAADVRRFFFAIQKLISEDLLLAYHDRSDGGLFVTVAEMAFGGRSGIDLNLDTLGNDQLAILFSEEIGSVIQVLNTDSERVRNVLMEHGLSDCVHAIGHPNDDDELRVRCNNKVIFRESASSLRSAWSELTYRMQCLRDNPDCARQEHDYNNDFSDPGPQYRVTFDEGDFIADKIDPKSAYASVEHPRIAILREQGINGQIEMGAAFDAAGFQAIDVTMTDLIDGRADLGQFQALAACGGFSYGDVLGAGVGWARSILFSEPLREMFTLFFERNDTVSLGVCNGCQMMANLKELIPGAESWPRFVRNLSEQFEARLVAVEVMETRSVLFAHMEGSRLPIAVAHGEGRVEFANYGSQNRLADNYQVGLRYINHHDEMAINYPFNPNGSPDGITAVTNSDGRHTIMMPHPERVFRNVQLSYRPNDWDVDGFSPWIELFRNAYRFATA